MVTGELALNTNDGKLYFKNSAGAVTLIASTASVSGVSVTGILKSNGTTISAAVSSTDYAPATSGTSILYGNGSGGFSNVTIGTGLTFVGGTLTGTSSGIAYFLSAQSTSAPNATIPVVSLSVLDPSYANLDIALVAKGTGATLAQIPDGSSTNGNKRGIYATDFQKIRASASQVASGNYSFIGGGQNNSATGLLGSVGGGLSNTAGADYSALFGGSNNFIGSAAPYSNIAGGQSNSIYVAASLNPDAGRWSAIGGGQANDNSSPFSVVAGGYGNVTTDTLSSAAITTQNGTLNSGNFNVTLSAFNSSIRVGQYITGSGIAAGTLVSSIAGTALVLTKVATLNGTSPLSFWSHSAVVGGGNLNRALGPFSFIGGGGTVGPATVGNQINAFTSFGSIVGGRNNSISTNSDYCSIGGGISNTSSTYAAAIGGGSSNTASNFYATVAGGTFNTASGNSSTVAGGSNNSASSDYGTVVGGQQGTDGGITGKIAFPGAGPLGSFPGRSQAGMYVLGRQTTNATGTVISTNGIGASATNQIVLPNTGAVYFRGEIIATVAGGGGNTKGWFVEGVVKRGANAASTVLVGTPTVTSNYADAGASTWAVAVTADTTLGGLTITVTGQASTSINWVAQIRTTEIGNN
jgi:hypothetical protein